MSEAQNDHIEACLGCGAVGCHLPRMGNVASSSPMIENPLHTCGGYIQKIPTVTCVQYDAMPETEKEEVHQWYVQSVKRLNERHGLFTAFSSSDHYIPHGKE